PRCAALASPSRWPTACCSSPRTRPPSSLARSSSSTAASSPSEQPPARGCSHGRGHGHEDVLHGAHLDLGEVGGRQVAEGAALGRGEVVLLLLRGVRLALEHADPDELVLGLVYPAAHDLEAILLVDGHQLLVP